MPAVSTSSTVGMPETVGAPVGSLLVDTGWGASTVPLTSIWWTLLFDLHEPLSKWRRLLATVHPDAGLSESSPLLWVFSNEIASVVLLARSITTK